MRRHLLHPLDRYVLGEFLRVFIATALGFPLLVIVIDLVDQLAKYLARNLTPGQIALSYVYGFPDSMFLVLPAAVLFATVFTIGGFTRHAEIAAAKSSGISFFRFVMPIFLASVAVAGFGLFLGELVPVTSARKNAILEAGTYATGQDRYNFTYAAERGRVYKIGSLRVDARALEDIEIERRGIGPSYPTYILTARSGSWTPEGGWMLRDGAMHVLPDSLTDRTFLFDSARDNRFTEAPASLTASARSPQEMRYAELGRFIAALGRSGADTRELQVERALKIVIPVASIIIAIFGAPLATGTQRGGAAYGIGISLATTVLYLMFIQITKAIGGGGLLPPVLAAWLPNLLFGTVGAVLLLRTRT